MFFKCSRCGNVWQYPVEKCPECFLGLERARSENIKVAAVSKTNIPTILHNKVPYFVLVLEDEKGNRWVHKSVQEYKIGDKFKTESSRDKNAVAIWRVKYDYLEAIEKSVDLAGGLEIEKNSKILLLPTLISPKHSYFADNTSPEFLEAVIKYLQEKGVRTENIKVAGQSFDEIPIGASAQKSQLLNVCQKFKINPLDLGQSKFVKKETAMRTAFSSSPSLSHRESLVFEISQEVFEADLVINIPILKMGKTSASDNLFKFLKKENYLGLKYLSSTEEILQGLTKILPPILTLADSQYVQNEDKVTAFLGLVMAGFNALNLDRVFAEITMSKLPETIKNVNISDIPILGRKVEEVQINSEK